MNALGRDIERGEVVIIKKGVHKVEYQPLEHRLFVVDSGFGMRHSNIGSALIGRYLINGVHARYEGSDVDKKATIDFQTKYGQYGQNYDKEKARESATS